MTRVCANSWPQVPFRVFPHWAQGCPAMHSSHGTEPHANSVPQRHDTQRSHWRARSVPHGEGEVMKGHFHFDAR